MCIRDRSPIPWLFAMMVTVCSVAMLVGAVYRPDEVSVPCAPDVIDQLMATAQVPVARNCWLCPA